MLMDLVEDKNQIIANEEEYPQLAHSPIPEEIPSTAEEPLKKEEKSSSFIALAELLAGTAPVEEKVRAAIDFMARAIAQTGSPHFKEFWEVKRLCLPLFKEFPSPALRSALWQEYAELTTEARRLKEILDKEAAFMVEQFKIAIQGLEADISHLQQLSDNLEPIACEVQDEVLKVHMAEYERLQKPLSMLNTFTSRIHSLRKELIKTEMRVRYKNSFFKELSALGDKVFPERKRLIKELSGLFVQHVEQFVQTHFVSGNLDKPHYYYRDEIKALQNVAKGLTLNTAAFTRTRSMLSECWDKIKKLDKEWKKEKNKRREASKEYFQQAMQKIDALVKALEEKKYSAKDADEQIYQLQNHLKKLPLDGDDLKAVKDRMHEIRGVVRMQERQAEEEREKLKQEKEQKRIETVAQLKVRVEELVAEAKEWRPEEIEERRLAMMQEIGKYAQELTTHEKQLLERTLKPLKEMVMEKQEQVFLSLPEGDFQTLQKYEELLKQRKERRVEIKGNVEQYRKLAGASGLDFEKAMQYNELMQEEKDKLQKVCEGIAEIEGKIAQLKKQAVV